MINKEYDELHKEFIEALVRYYNTHNYFLTKPSKVTSRELVRNIVEIRNITARMKDNYAVVRTQMRADEAAYRAEKKKRNKTKYV